MLDKIPGNINVLKSLTKLFTIRETEYPSIDHFLFCDRRNLRVLNCELLRWVAFLHLRVFLEKTKLLGFFTSSEKIDVGIA